MENSLFNQAGICSFVAGVLSLLAVSCVGQVATSTNGFQPHFDGQAPGEKQAILHRMEGPVSAVDAKKMTLAVKVAEGDRTFKVTSKTKFTRNTTPATLSDVAVGQPVEVVVKMVYGQPDEIVTVNIKSP